METEFALKSKQNIKQSNKSQTSKQVHGPKSALLDNSSRSDRVKMYDQQEPRNTKHGRQTENYITCTTPIVQTRRKEKKTTRIIIYTNKKNTHICSRAHHLRVICCRSTVFCVSLYANPTLTFAKTNWLWYRLFQTTAPWGMFLGTSPPKMSRSTSSRLSYLWIDITRPRNEALW